MADFDPEHFWKWTDFLSYVEFSLTFTLLVGIVTLLLINVPVYVELLGFAAVFTEAMLGAPQFYRNFQNKSTVGMRYEPLCQHSIFNLYFIYIFALILMRNKEMCLFRLFFIFLFSFAKTEEIFFLFSSNDVVFKYISVCSLCI